MLLQFAYTRSMAVLEGLVVKSVRLLLCFSVALALVWAPVFPLPANGQSTPSAGHVAVVIPRVSLQRGTQQLVASPHTPVFWGDVVDTARLARARIALNDGSLLNVGSESSLQIVRQDAPAQQTQLELTYGRVRARVVHLTKPGSSFQIRTRVGTAGVIGTDFYLDLEGDVLQLIVFEGVVRFCNLAGVCVNVGAGKLSIIRGNQPPAAPTNIPNALLSDAVKSTTVVVGQTGEGLAVSQVASHRWFYLGLFTALAIVPVIIAVTQGSTRKTSSTPLVIQCPPAAAVPAACTQPALIGLRGSVAVRR
jgi:hypothetical protein